MENKPRVITIANQKGGIGKTTTATTITKILSRMGYKALLIDTDVQCNSTDVYRAQMDGVATIYDVLIADEKVSLKEAVQKTEAGEIVASDRLLVNADTVLKNDPVSGIFRLQDAMEGMKGYDFVVIDTNPTLNQLLYNCLVASDEVVIPVTADRFGLTGLNQLNETIQSVKSRPNKNLRIAGLLIIKYKDNMNLERDVRKNLAEIAEQMGTKLFHTTIRECVKVRESQAVRIPLTDYAPHCTSSRDYEAFVKELVKEG